jgi:hypothetical protein
MPRPRPKVEPARLVVARLPHNRYDRAQLLLFVGMRGFGKTTAIVDYIESAEPRLLGVDPYNDLMRVMRVEDLDDALSRLAEDLAMPCRVRIVPSLNEQDPIAVSCTLPDHREMSISRHFGAHMFERIVRSGARNYLLALDELTRWTSERANVWMLEAIMQGRRLGIRIVSAIQHLSMAPQALRSELTGLVLFKTIDPLDLKRTADWVGDETAELLPTLEVGQCIYCPL